MLVVVEYIIRNAVRAEIERWELLGIIYTSKMAVLASRHYFKLSSPRRDDSAHRCPARCHTPFLHYYFFGVFWRRPLPASFNSCRPLPLVCLSAGSGDTSPVPPSRQGRRRRSATNRRRHRGKKKVRRGREGCIRTNEGSSASAASLPYFGQFAAWWGNVYLVCNCKARHRNRDRVHRGWNRILTCCLLYYCTTLLLPGMRLQLHPRRDMNQMNDILFRHIFMPCSHEEQRNRQKSTKKGRSGPTRKIEKP